MLPASVSPRKPPSLGIDDLNDLDGHLLKFSIHLHTGIPHPHSRRSLHPSQPTQVTLPDHAVTPPRSAIDEHRRADRRNRQVRADTSARLRLLTQLAVSNPYTPTALFTAARPMHQEFRDSLLVDVFKACACACGRNLEALLEALAQSRPAHYSHLVAPNGRGVLVQDEDRCSSSCGPDARSVLFPCLGRPGAEAGASCPGESRYFASEVKQSMLNSLDVRWYKIHRHLQLL